MQNNTMILYMEYTLKKMNVKLYRLIFYIAPIERCAKIKKASKEKSRIKKLCNKHGISQRMRLAPRLDNILLKD